MRISDEIDRSSNPQFVGGCSSVGRASAFQAEGREFESRRPLQFFDDWDSRPRSSGVERLLGKEEVMSSNLIAGSSDCELALDCATITNAYMKRPGRDVEGKI